MAGAREGASRLRWAAPALALVVLLLGGAYALVVPPGEAPDEAAHIAYVDHLLRRHTLPPLAEPPYGDRYEAYQAPLDYLTMAVAARALGVRTVGLALRPNPSFSFFRQGSRAYLPAADEVAASGIRALRLTRLVWAVITAVLVLLTASRLAHGRTGLALAATAPFVLSPQFLFVNATVNNDGAVTACAALATFAFTELLLQAVHPSPRISLLAAVAGIAVGLAPFGKISGFLLLAPLALVAALLAHRRQPRAALWLLAPAAALSALWLGLAAWRFGSFFPPPPTGLRTGLGAAGELVGAHWLGSVALSFWAKFGWFNLRLPAVAYGLFVAPTVLVAIGCFGGAADRHDPPVDPWPRRVFAGTLATNLMLLMIFLVRIDWQPQGRFLFSSLPAMAALAALSLHRLASPDRSRRWRRWAIPGFLILCALTAAVVGLGVIARAYG
jgi:4-amino-4-deoxy-L-arabinose transferase-like glycosyltransferase